MTVFNHGRWCNHCRYSHRFQWLLFSFEFIPFKMLHSLTGVQNLFPCRKWCSIVSILYLCDVYSFYSLIKLQSIQGKIRTEKMGRFFKIFTYSEIFLRYNFIQSVLIVLFFLFSYHLQLLILTISQLAIFYPCVKEFGK